MTWGIRRVLDARLQAVQSVVGRASRRAVAQQMLLAPRQSLLVSGGGAQRVQVGRETTNRRRIGTTIVVDDNHDATILRRRNVIECLPREAASQRAVADNAHGPRAVPLAMLLARDAVHPRNRRRRMRGLDDVVLGFTA